MNFSLYRIRYDDIQKVIAQINSEVSFLILTCEERINENQLSHLKSIEFRQAVRESPFQLIRLITTLRKLVYYKNGQIIGEEPGFLQMLIPVEA